jgi:hypothetical protein
MQKASQEMEALFLTKRSGVVASFVVPSFSIVKILRKCQMPRAFTRLPHTSIIMAMINILPSWEGLCNEALLFVLVAEYLMHCVGGSLLLDRETFSLSCLTLLFPLHKRH